MYSLPPVKLKKVHVVAPVKFRFFCKAEFPLIFRLWNYDFPFPCTPLLPPPPPIEVEKSPCGPPCAFPTFPTSANRGAEAQGSKTSPKSVPQGSKASPHSGVQSSKARRGKGRHEVYHMVQKQVLTLWYKV